MSLSYESQPPANRQGRYIVAAVGVVAVVLVVFSIFAPIISQAGKTTQVGTQVQSQAGDSDSARVFCRYVAEQNLRAPATADFSGYSDTTAGRLGTGWQVKGYVDAQNGFGAKIRSDYDCRVTWDGTPNWHLDGFTLTPR